MVAGGSLGRLTMKPFISLLALAVVTGPGPASASHHMIHGSGTNDVLTLTPGSEVVEGGSGTDTLSINTSSARYDFAPLANGVVMTDWLTGRSITAHSIEKFAFEDATLTAERLAQIGSELTIRVSRGTQAVSINNPEPTVVTLWNRSALAAVIEIGTVGPTPAARAYGMLNTAIYDAWAAHSRTALRVSYDRDGDNRSLEARADVADVEVAVSYAAHAVLSDLFPTQTDLFDMQLTERLGLARGGDGSIAARIGLDTADDLQALRHGDGANQLEGYADTIGYRAVNIHPGAIRDIARWTPEYVPIDPGDPRPEQAFLTPHWADVESFALPEDTTGRTVFATIRPAPPEPFFVPEHAGAVPDLDCGTITLSAALNLNGTRHAPGDRIAVSRALVGPVINPAFIAQAEELVSYSAGLSERDELQAEFFEDGTGTAFPPGSWICFAEYVSARDDHDLADDVAMFFMVGNAVMDAGIATWEAKVHYDYARPVRVIRALGRLGLIGAPGVDELTGESGYVIRAWGGIDPETGADLGTRTILAQNFHTYQRWQGHPSPPFCEYTSGHSAFSAAAAAALRLYTGSDAFGADVTFAPGAAQFVPGLPSEPVTLGWPTFMAAAEAAGRSRLYGQIHFADGNEAGLELGRDVGGASTPLRSASSTAPRPT